MLHSLVRILVVLSANVTVSINWHETSLSILGTKEKETYYYLPACIECTPVFYRKGKTVVAFSYTHIGKTLQKTKNEGTGWTDWTDRHTTGEPGLKAKAVEEKWSLCEVAGNKVNWTRSFWLQMLWDLSFFSQIPFSWHLELKNQEQCLCCVITHLLVGATTHARCS